MAMNIAKELAESAERIAARAALEYLRARGLQADTKALSECATSWLRIKIPEGLADAKAAFDCGMVEVGKQTFMASCFQAGIEAAKECGMPL